MKIAIDARLILPHMTGIGRYLLGLAGGLRDLPGDDRIEMWLQAGLPASHPAWSLQTDRLRLRRLPAAHMGLRQAWVLPAAVRRAHPDLLHYPHFDLPLATPGPVVATFHDLKYLVRPEFFPTFGKVKRLAILAMLAHTARRASRLIVPSENTRQDLLRLLRIAPHKVSVVPEGVQASFFEPPAPQAVEAMRQRYGLHRPFILFVGERRPHKNLPGLLRAFARLRSATSSPFELVIAGQPYGGYRAPERWVEQLDLGRQVRFLDYVPDEDLPGLYRAAQALALLSFYEGFGLPVLEAMASGVPVVASDRTALPETVGEAGLLVPPDDPEAAAEALLQAVSGGERRETLITAGLARAYRFTWQRSAQATYQVYRAAIQA